MLSLPTGSVATALALTCLLLARTALAQPAPPDPAPPRPYNKVAVTLPSPVDDPSFDAFRKQLADIAQRKDRAALGALIVPQGVFWKREGGNAADEKKSGIDNFAAATGLDEQDGWEFLADYAAEPTASPAGDRQDLLCAPATPAFNQDEFLAVLKATETNPVEWGYPLLDG